MSNEHYTIVASGERLVFTRDQIESDPGNYFATFFFGDFSEGSRGVRELVVEKDVQIFRLIQAYLRGYEIFPLPQSSVPKYMTMEVAIVNLFRDAQFYSLKNLEERIKAFKPDIAAHPANPPAKVHTPASERTYKFANFRGHWIINDTTFEGYQCILERLAKSPEKQLRTNKKLKCPGCTQVLCWIDGPKEGSCALLVSNPT